MIISETAGPEDDGAQLGGAGTTRVVEVHKRKAGPGHCILQQRDRRCRRHEMLAAQMQKRAHTHRGVGRRSIAGRDSVGGVTRQLGARSCAIGVATLADRPLVRFFWRVLDRLDCWLTQGEVMAGGRGVRPLAVDGNRGGTVMTSGFNLGRHAEIHGPAPSE